MEILIVVVNCKTALAPCNLTFTFSFFYLFIFFKNTQLKCFASAASNHGLNDIQMYYNIKTLHLFSNYS